MSLGKGVFTSREQLVLSNIRGYCWEPGGTNSKPCPRAVGCFPREYAPVACRDFAPDFTPVLINRPSDLMDQFGCLFAFSGSSLCDHPVLFDQTLSPPVLSGLGILVVTDVHFDESGSVMYLGGDSVRSEFGGVS